MINRPSKSANPTHYFSAVFKCALLLIFFTFGVEVYAQSYNMSESYRIGGSTQPTPSATQGGYGMMDAGYQAFDHGYRVMSGINTQASEYKMYQGVVYEPFNDTPPSENNSDRRGISGRRNSNYEGDVDLGEWGDPTTANPGNTSNQSPIGEPWILLLFAAVAAAVVAWRQRRAVLRG